MSDTINAIIGHVLRRPSEPKYRHVVIVDLGSAYPILLSSARMINPNFSLVDDDEIVSIILTKMAMEMGHCEELFTGRELCKAAQVSEVSVTNQIISFPAKMVKFLYNLITHNSWDENGEPYIINYIKVRAGIVYLCSK